MIAMPKLILTVAAFSGMLAVILRAFGAHALKGHLPPDQMDVYLLASQYHFYHTLALLFLGLLALKFPGNAWLGWGTALMVAGLVLFCGGLYLKIITGQQWIGVVSPLGGISLILSWLLVAIAVMRQTV